MYVLDTDTLTLAFHENETVLSKMTGASGEVVTSIVTRVEILGGRIDRLVKAANAIELLRAQDLLGDSESHLSGFRILTLDESSAKFSDRFRKDKKTRTIRLKDLLIACICLAYDATLVTRNVKDFKNIPNLRLENWAD